MIEQTTEEVAEAIKENPRAWAQQYIDLMDMCCELQRQNEKLTLALLPTPKQH